MGGKSKSKPYLGSPVNFLERFYIYSLFRIMILGLSPRIYNSLRKVNMKNSWLHAHNSRKPSENKGIEEEYIEYIRGIDLHIGIRLATQLNRLISSEQFLLWGKMGWLGGP